MAEPSYLIKKADILDELISPTITADTDAIFAEADAYIDNLIKRLDDEYDKSDLPATLPYEVKLLMIAWIGMTTCARKMGSAGSSFKNQDAGDKWGNKLKYFQDEVAKYEAMMTIELLTGLEMPEVNPGTITLGRA